MEILTSEQMKKVDEETIERFCPGLELMERAGAMVSDFISEEFDGKREKAVIFAGSGNNGGDALVAARKLSKRGFRCSVYLLKPPEKFAVDAMKNYQRLKKLVKESKQLVEYSLERADWPELLEKDMVDATLIVDGLFGTGIKGGLRGKVLEVVKFINNSGVPVVSIDIPSGVDGDTGEVLSQAVRAAYTVTIGRPKMGLLFHPGKDYVGDMIIADIGFPGEVVEAHAEGIYLLDDDEAARHIPLRAPDAHKYKCGSLLIIAGSRRYTGAALLAGEAALRAGCGIVTLAVPKGVRDIVEAGVKEAITVPLPETSEGTISKDAKKLIDEYKENADAIAIGPGLARNEETDAFVREFLAGNSIPVVLDADGLNAYAGRGEELSGIPAPLVITPHSGEFVRIFSREIPGRPLEKIALTRQTAGKTGVVIVHKGAPSIVASPEGGAYVSFHGNSALATGGSGDVLTGFIGSFLAQGAGELDAALIGCVLLGLAGEKASEDLGIRGVVAGDLPLFAAMAMPELEAASAHFHRNE